MDRESKTPKTGAKPSAAGPPRKRAGGRALTPAQRSKEALAQQAATAEVMRVMAATRTDVQPVLDAVTRLAAELCRAPFALVSLVEGTTLIARASYPAEAISLFLPVELGRTSVSGRATVDRTTIHHADVVPLLEREFPDAREDAHKSGFRAVLAVPLELNGQGYGAILLWRREVGFFAPDQVALVETFARQAAMAIENVRQFHATEEAREQQTATGEILRVISNSRTDVQPVFDAIAAAALTLCHATSALVTRVEGAAVALVASANLTQEGAAAMRAAFPMPVSRRATSARAILEGRVIAIPDVLTDPDYEVQAYALRAQFRSTLAVPLMRDGQPIGTITVGKPESGRFSDAQIALLQTFADQAVIAIENVRVFTELQERTRELTRSVGELKALGEVGQAVSSTLELETVLATIASRATALAGMDGGAIFEYDEARQAFHLHTTDRLPDELVAGLGAAPIPKGEGAIGGLALTGEPVQIRDIAAEGIYQSRVREILLRHRYRSLLAVPLLREDRLLGGLVVTRKTAGDFAPEVIELLKTFATQSALAIQNARLYREIEVKSRALEVAGRHKSEFLANMSHELRTPLNAIIGFSEVLSERMFGEINEKQAEYIGDILESGRHLLSLINDILDLSKIEAGRMELELTDFDLASTIESTLILVRERAQRRGIVLRRTVDERLGIIRADERKVKQVLLNLLSNALKFTPEGGRIDVRGAALDGIAEISVTDTGVGIAAADQEAVFEEFRQVGTADKKVEGTGLGLAISRKFIELHGGKIWVTSKVGSGSTFTFALPLRQPSV